MWVTVDIRDSARSLMEGSITTRTPISLKFDKNKGSSNVYLMEVLNVLVQLMMKCATIVTFSKFDLCDIEN
jgi:hypothetical protein